MTKNILVIDDEELVSKSLQKLLKKEGYNPVIAVNAQEAIQKVKNLDFDLIVCDVRMPEVDGIEIIKGIRKLLEEEGKKHPPEVLITGYADEDIYKNALNLKITDYMYKPFDTKEFLEIIKRNLK